MTVVSWSTHREDVVLWRALQDVPAAEGFYIDVGAHDAGPHSNTRLLYDHGWHGIAVEPSPTWANRQATERPRDILVRAAASDQAGRIVLYDHATWGLGTVEDSVARRHRDEIGVTLDPIEVEAVTLADICARHAPPQIHLLKIDVEGHERQVLAGMDFARFRPWILCLKATEPMRATESHHDWEAQVLTAGYRFVRFDGSNRWYVAQEHGERFAALSLPADDYVHHSQADGGTLGLHRPPVGLGEETAAVRAQLARQVVEYTGYRGDPANSLYRAFVGSERPVSSPPQPVPFTSSLCHQLHFGLDQYRFWTRALKESPKYQRKQWEFVFIAQALYERGFLTGGMNGLVFGAGQEQLPALFASFGVKVLATDQAPETAVTHGWAESNQHTYDVSALNQRGICTDRMFSDLVSFEPVDMNAIPASLDGRFDFCWSACAFEHLGSLQHGLDFVVNSMATLKPGGVAVHTTEYNISSNTDTMETDGCSIYRRCDIEQLVDRLTEQGSKVSPIDWDLGEGFAETVIDLPPFWGRGEPHIRLRVGEHDVTSIGLIIEKPLA